MRILNLLIITLFSISLLSNFIPPEIFWGAGLLVFLIPIIPFLSPIFSIYYFFKFNKGFFLSYSLIFIFSLYRFNSNFNFVSKNKSSENTFSIMSYNVSFFNKQKTFSKEYYDPEHNIKALQIREWLSYNSTDIMCLQEFFDDKNSLFLNNIEYLLKIRNYEQHFLYEQKHDNGIRGGLIILSKYPIINKGQVFFSKNGYNGAIYTDVKIDNDTIRIVNAHLESMQLSTKRNKPKELVHSLKRGILKHNSQTKLLLEFLEKSQYEVILCCDLNEPPYSYAYHKINSLLKNSFEEGGKGFGFTYNGNLLKFIRIDNQFHSENIDLQSFKTVNDFEASKHFPLIGSYSIKGNRRPKYITTKGYRR